MARAAYGLGVKAAKNTDTGVQKENASAGAGAKASIDHNAEKKGFKEDKYFKSQMRKWDSLKHGSYVKVGELGTQHPLCMVGMPAGTLRYDVDKLKRNMSDHADYLTTALLEEIPKIIAEPMAISQFSEENTVSVFGNIFVGDSPMMVGVTISKDRAGNDISKVRTYNARRDVGGLLTDESVLYLGEDKKRTLQWFQACGIQVPLGGTKFGFIRSISQNYKKSNTISKKTSNSREESADHEQTVRIRDGGKRDGGTDPRGEVSRAEGGAKPNQARWQAQRRARDHGAASLTYGEKVSAASLGITGGTDSATVRLVESGETAAMKEAKRMAEERGLTVTFFSGTLQVRRNKGQGVAYARALIDGDKVYIRVDHDTYTADQLMKHEVGHDMIAKGEVDVNRVRRRLAERYSKENLKKVAMEYAEAYAMTDMTAEEIWEEIICDSLADMNAFAPQETLEALNQEMAEMIKSETEASRKEARGPPQRTDATKTKHSNDDNLGLTEEDMDEYMRTGKELHTRNKKRRMLENGKNPILTSIYETKKFILEAIDGKALGEVRAFGKVGGRLANAIMRVRNGFDLYGYYIELNADDLREAYKKHKQPKEPGNISLEDSDFESIPEFMNEFDGITSIDTHKGRTQIHLYKRISRGYVHILTVSSTQRKSIIVTKLIGMSTEQFEQKYSKKMERDTGSPRGQTDTSDASTPSTKARLTAGALSNNSIPQNSDLSTESAKKYSGKIGKTSRETSSDADTDVNENEAGGASPSPTDVETEVQNEAVARVEKACRVTQKEKPTSVGFSFVLRW